MDLLGPLGIWSMWKRLKAHGKPLMLAPLAHRRARRVAVCTGYGLCAWWPLCGVRPVMELLGWGAALHACGRVLKSDVADGTCPCCTGQRRRRWRHPWRRRQRRGGHAACSFGDRRSSRVQFLQNEFGLRRTFRCMLRPKLLTG